MKKLLAVLFIVLFTLIPSACSAEKEKASEEQADTVLTEPNDTAADKDFEYSVKDGKVNIKKYIAQEKTVIIPDTIEGLPINTIAEGFLKDSAVEEITFPSYYREYTGIGSCESLKVVHFPCPLEKVTGHFRFCANLTEIDAAEGKAYKASDGVLYTADCKTLVAYPRGRTGSFKVPDGVNTVGQFAFSGSKLSEIVLPDTLSTIEKYAFFETEELREITVPASVRLIGFSAFQKSGIKTAKLSEGLEEIESGAFEKTGIKELYLPDSVKKCGVYITDENVSISASLPSEGIKSLLFKENVTFRDETLLEEAFRVAEKELINNDDEILGTRGTVFTDLTGDGFPEAVQLVNDNSLYFYCYNTVSKSWETDWSLYRYDSHCNGIIPVYYLCYDDDTDSYGYYSDLYTYYRYNGWHWDDENELTAETETVQYCVFFTENGVKTYELFGDKIIEPSEEEIIKTLDINEVLSEYDFDPNDKYRKFVIITDNFSEGPGGKAFEKELTVKGEQIVEYPYYKSFYPDSMKLLVTGIDILREEAPDGVYYRDNALVFDNAVIDAKDNYFIIRTEGMDRLTIKLLGDNRIVSDSFCSLFSTVRIPLVIEGNGSLEAPKIEADSITITEGAKVYVNEELVSEENVTGIIVSHTMTGKYGVHAYKLSLRENAFLECRNIRVNTVYLSGSASAVLKKAAVDFIDLSGDSTMNVVNDSGSVISYVHGITVSDNGRLYADSTGSGHDPIYFDGSLYAVRVYGSGIIEINGNSNSTGLSLGNAGSGTLTVNDNGKVIINGALTFTCLNNSTQQAADE